MKNIYICIIKLYSMTNTFKAISVALFLAFSNQIIAQQVNDGGTLVAGQVADDIYNTITTAVPFLTIAPDSRGGGMGDVGVASTADVWSQNWNASKYALTENDLAVGMTYTPWLAHITKDIHLLYVAGYKKLKGEDALGASLRYFSVGDIPAYDENGEPAGYDISPREFALDVSYSRKLADKFVMALTGRFIFSNLHAAGSSEEFKPGRAIAADISGTYFEDKLRLGGLPAAFRAGFNISNIGSKIAYTEDQKDFIPTNLKVGAGLNLEVDKHNDVAFYLDLNKLLVPTSPLMDNEGNIIEGKDPDVAPITGIFQSFFDAPGGFEEELKEIAISGGVEYWYNKQLALRGGYFHEAKTKGNRKYFTLGVGLRMKVVGIDVAYLIPMQGTNSPLANTFRFSLSVDLGA